MNAQRLERLVEQVRTLEDPQARDAALELVQAVMDLHAAALDRVMDLVSESELGGMLFDQFAKDSSIGSVLLLHDLHPLELETRVRRALEHPFPAARSGQVRVVSVERGIVHIRVSGGAALETQVRDAILEAAPDAAGIVIESAAPPVQAAFVPLQQLLTR